VHTQKEKEKTHSGVFICTYPCLPRERMMLGARMNE